MKRLYFIAGSDRFEIDGVTFDKGGHSQEVSDETAEYLRTFPGYEFDELSASEAHAEDKADKVAGRDSENSGQISPDEAEAAARRAEFYGVDTGQQPEILKSGDPDVDEAEAALRRGAFYGTESVADTEAEIEHIEEETPEEIVREDEEYEAEAIKQAAIESEIEPQDTASA